MPQSPTAPPQSAGGTLAPHSRLMDAWAEGEGLTERHTAHEHTVAPQLSARIPVRLHAYAPVLQSIGGGQALMNANANIVGRPPHRMQRRCLLHRPHRQRKVCHRGMIPHADVVRSPSPTRHGLVRPLTSSDTGIEPPSETGQMTVWLRAPLQTLKAEVCAPPPRCLLWFLWFLEVLHSMSADGRRLRSSQDSPRPRSRTVQER